MHNILLVDDDPATLRVYSYTLMKKGYLVDTAKDGFAALEAMRSRKPDIVILDLMMPRLSGAEVLKLMHSKPELQSLPVIVLSNAYIGTLTTEAAEAGAQKGLLKVSCTPSILIDAIEDVLGQARGNAQKQTPDHLSKLLAVSEMPEPGPALDKRLLNVEPDRQRIGNTELIPKIAPTPAPAASAPPSSSNELREQFLAGAETTCEGLRSAFKSFCTATPGDQQNLRLQDLCRRVHFVTAAASLADCSRLAQMATAFEALLFRMMDDPTRITTSVFRTIDMTIGFLQLLFHEAKKGLLGPTVAGNVLVVDDDAVSNRLVVWALSQAGLHAKAVENPTKGLGELTQRGYDLILLDIEMPGMNGFEFCKQLRNRPAYAKTPVIYVTAHSDFESREKSVVSGGDDLIGKPVLPMELAVKALTHLLKRFPARPDAQKSPPIRLVG